MGRRADRAISLTMTALFPPTRAAGLARLATFTPSMGRPYAAGRNTDPGPDGAQAVSRLSPYVRRRLLGEDELVRAAVGVHGPQRADKFVEEVVWRSYFKGWLEHRPAVWTAYRQDLARAADRLAVEAGLRRVFQDATEGATGIACFDAWARELVETNWLHNHTRMWFASIWIFTLRLPWALGADFFARHLLDGDPAANTLSWRWVAGLHTRGKHYVARAANIARYTEGRFDPAGQLDEDPEPLTEDRPLPSPRLPPADPMPLGTVALLLHDDDLCPETFPLGPNWSATRVGAIATTSAVAGMARHGVAAPVAGFVDAALADAARRAEAAFDTAAIRLAPSDVAAWVRGSPHPVVAPYAPVGPNADLLAGLDVAQVRRPWDDTAWPHATRGYFQMRAVIPDLVALAMEADGAS